VGNLDGNLVYYFKLSFTMASVGNLDPNLRCYFMYFL